METLIVIGSAIYLFSFFNANYNIRLIKEISEKQNAILERIANAIEQESEEITE